MTHLTESEAKRYEFFNTEAKRRELTGPELREYRELGEKYAVQLKAEGEAYRARREKDMADFLAEKKAHGDALAKWNATDPEGRGPAPQFEREFPEWLKLKGRV